MRFFIVGDGDERANIEIRVNEINNKYGKVIDMTSWVKDIGEFNAGMDIICLTSDNEGTPVSLIEAQAGGLPVITTDVGGVRDIVLEGKTGYIVPKNNVSLFVEKLLLLVENEVERNRLSKNGWDFVKEKFHYTTLVKNMDGYYQYLLLNKKK